MVIANVSIWGLSYVARPGSPASQFRDQSWEIYAILFGFQVALYAVLWAIAWLKWNRYIVVEGDRARWNRGD